MSTLQSLAAEDPAVGEAVLAKQDFMDSETVQCPFDFYAAARAVAPVYKLPKSPAPGTDVYLVTRYDLIQAVQKDWRTFSNRFGHLMGGRNRLDPEVAAILAEGYPTAETLLTQDPPTQRHYRTLLTKSFSVARVEQMTGYITQICDDLIDKFIDKGRCDFFADFAVPLPLYVVADLLGVPREDVDKFKRWSDDGIANIGRMKGRDVALRSARSSVEMQKYFAATFEQRRLDPRKDIISDLAQAKYQNERPLTVSEALSLILAVVVAGNETARNAMAGGMVYVINKPAAQDRFAADPSLVPNAVEEILRLEAPTKHMWRVVTTDTELAGTKIPAGSALLLSYDAANRDELKFPDGDACVFARENAADHLSFGAGIHFCIGALLARKEMTIAFQRLFVRLKNIRLAEDQEPLRYLESILHRGFETLKLEFDRRA
jgi:cytochrome P450